jgi:hypothetical protein
VVVAAVHQSGATVTAGDLRSNASIAPGATTTFGVVGTRHLSAAPPKSFTLNGIACRPN